MSVCNSNIKNDPKLYFNISGGGYEEVSYRC